MALNTGNAWKCTVCGYVHRGDVPPDVCPVCGAPKKLFEPYQDAVENGVVQQSGQWRCLVCNYEHYGDSPPERCPVCGASSKKFEQMVKSREGAEDSSLLDHVVIVGGSIAGVSAIEAIRKISGSVKITLITKENHLPYYRLNLTRLLAEEITAEHISIHDENWYMENKVDLLLDTEVAELSIETHEIKTTGGKTYPFDKLILTAGAHPFIPPVPGIHMEGVTPLRTLSDADYIRKSAEKVNSVAIIGGGVLGLEIAGALIKHTKNVTVLEGFDYLMPRQLTKRAATLLETFISNLGIQLKTGVSIKELVGDERVAGVKLDSGEVVKADLVIFSTGVRSNSYLARSSGLQVNQGIIVNDYLQSSQKDVFAAGDIAEHRGVLYGLWNAAQYQGSIAGMNAIGKEAEFGGLPRSNTLKVLGVDLFSIGIFEAEDASFRVVEKESGSHYMRFVFHDSHLVGAILYGDTTCSAGVKKAIENKKDFSDIIQKNTGVEEICTLLSPQ